MTNTTKHNPTSNKHSVNNKRGHEEFSRHGKQNVVEFCESFTASMYMYIYWFSSHR